MIIRLMAAVVIVGAMVFGWRYVEPLFFPAPAKTAPAKPGPQIAAVTGSGAASTGTAPAVKPPVLKAVGLPAEASAPSVRLGSDTVDGRYDLAVEILPRGAAVSQITLSRARFFQTVADRKEPADERAAMALVEPASPPAFTIPELRLRMKGAEEWSQVDLSETPWKPLPSESASQAAFSVEVQDENGRTLLEVRKTYRLFVLPVEAKARAEAPPQYEMRMTVEFLSVDPSIEKMTYAVAGPPALPIEGGRSGLPAAVFGKWNQGTVDLKQVAAASYKEGEPLKPAENEAGPEVAWAGQMDKYFAVVLIPQKPPEESAAPAVEGRTFVAGAEAVWYKSGTGPAALAVPCPRLFSEITPARIYPPGVGLWRHPERLFSTDLQPDGSDPPDMSRTDPLRLFSTPPLPARCKPVVHEYAVYAGPKDDGLLEKMYGPLGLTKLIGWANPCCYFVSIPGIEYLSRFLVVALEFFHDLGLNYGLAIMLLVVGLRAAMHPITRWSTKSMMQMQELAPKMQEIREKHADDKQKMQEEMQKIGGLKMFGGCLPMFLQMPIWIALYTALGVAITLRHASFIPAGWLPAGSLFLQDLSAPDTLLKWTMPLFVPGQNIPLLGSVLGGLQGMLSGAPGVGITTFNILPVLMGVSMYLQQKMTPQPPATNPQQQQQRKMMNLMSVFFAVMLYSAPAGLNLYIATSTALGLVEQRYIKRKIAREKKEKDERAAEAAKAGAPPKPGVTAKPVSAVAGRQKSLAERAQAWVQKTIEQGRQAEEGDRKGKKRGR